MTASTEQDVIAPLTTFLRAKLPERDGLVVSGMTRNVGGASRETWFADVAWRGVGGRELTTTLTVRVDHAEAMPVPVPIRHEFDIYKALSDGPIPVPRALWFETDPTCFGRPFYVREVIAGSAAPKKILAPGNEDLARAMGAQLATWLARIHTFDWKSSSLPEIMTVPESPELAPLVEVDRWADYHRMNRFEFKPGLAEMVSWLRRNPPADVDRLSLVWGDVGLGNFIYSDREIVGLIDWEFAHLDDPMRDWAAAFARGVGHLLPREELFEIYERESGIRVDERNIRYHSVLLHTQYMILGQPIMQDIVLRGGTVDVSRVRTFMGFPLSSQRNGMSLLATEAELGRP